MFKLGRTLSQESHDQIAEVIARHLDAFAWSASNMSGTDPDLLLGLLVSKFKRGGVN